MYHHCRNALFTVTMLLSAAGCGGRDMAQVHGRVTFDGQPVTSGVVIFSPVPGNNQTEPGKSSTGDIQPDGSFQLSTYKLHDGAIVGHHRVRYMRSTEVEKKNSDSTAKRKSGYANLTLPADFVADVESGGNNEIHIELVRRTSR